MSITSLQLLAAFLIWIISLFGGYLANRLHKRSHSHHNLMQIAEAFAGGIFLGAALFHMLPDAETALKIVSPDMKYPFANLICASGFCVLLLMEQITQRYQHKAASYQQHLVPILITALISIHALSEGIALGVNQETANILLIFIAIAVHKGSEGFAVGLQLSRSQLSLLQIILLFGLFSFMSPLGVSLGILAEHIIQKTASELLTGIFNAFAAGTFLYIATLHKLYHHHEQGKIPLQEFSATFIGLMLMAGVAIWL